VAVAKLLAIFQRRADRTTRRDGSAGPRCRPRCRSTRPQVGTSIMAYRAV
jgi:hypothetical protein